MVCDMLIIGVSFDQSLIDQWLSFACGKDFPSRVVNTADLSMLMTRAKKPRRVGSIPWQWYSPIHARKKLVSSALNHVLKCVVSDRHYPILQLA